MMISSPALLVLLMTLELNPWNWEMFPWKLASPSVQVDANTSFYLSFGLRIFLSEQFELVGSLLCWK